MKEECGLDVNSLYDQVESGYKVHGSIATLFEPFTIGEEVGDHSFIGIFAICKVIGGEMKQTSEGKNQKWVSIRKLEDMLECRVILPIVAPGLKKYVNYMKNMGVL